MKGNKFYSRTCQVNRKPYFSLEKKKFTRVSTNKETYFIVK